MTSTEFDRSRCSIAGTLSVVGEKWSMLVLREAFLGVRRFADFQAAIGAPRAVLTQRLATLVDHGVFERVPYQAEGQRERLEYRLTERGLDLYPILVAMLTWGDQHTAGESGGPVALQHDGCGAKVGLTLTCADGHVVPGPRAVTPVPTTPAR